MFLGSFFYFILNIDILSKAARDRKASVDANKKPQLLKQPIS